MEEYLITTDNEPHYTCTVKENDVKKFTLKKIKSESFHDAGETLITIKDTGDGIKVGKHSYEYHELQELYCILKVVMEHNDSEFGGEVSLYKKQ